MKKIVKEWGLFVLIIILLTTTSLGTEVATLAQRAILFTGIIKPGTEVTKEAEEFNYGFTLKSVSGETTHVSEFKGKLIFLNVWASWCAPCRAEMPGIQELYDEIDRENIVFIMLSVDKNEKSAWNYINKKGFSFPAYVLSGYPTKQVAVPSLPTTLIISPEGKIIEKKVGMAKYNTSSFRKFLEKHSKIN